MLTLILLPFLDYGYIQNSKIRIFYNYWFWFFISNIVLVSWFGAMSASEPFYLIGKISVLIFFAEIFYIVPSLNRVEILLVDE
jgi:quinol-cytochrome oxidoreductase complex cytochrome b subunit